MISDHVKGKKKDDFPLRIRNGIALHRAIDSFTDSHPATRIAKDLFRPAYRLYSGAIMDVLYDHFLATDLNEFDDQKLLKFSEQVYSSVDQQSRYFPATFAKMFPYMKEQNWLYNYRTMNGTSKSLGGMAYRATYITETDTALGIFRDNYQLLTGCYRQLWADIKPFAKNLFELHEADL